MANEKLFKLTKNEAYFLKKILPTCKLTAYQIPLFQSVMDALDNPIKMSDEIDKMNRVYPTVSPTVSDDSQRLLTPAQPVVHIPIGQSPVNPIEDNTDYLNKITEHFQSPGMVKPIIQDKPIETTVPVVEESDIENIEEPITGMFDVIDSRSK